MDEDLECVIVLVKLIAEHILPPPELCGSILKIFISDSGNDLTNHILDHRWNEFGKALAKLSNERDKYQQPSHLPASPNDVP